MRTVFVSSTGARSGQSLTAWLMMEMFHSSGLRTGFFKPFVTRPTAHDGRVVDRDALLMKTCYDLSEDLELICPIVVDEVSGDEVVREEQLEKIDECYRALKEGKDALVIMGAEQIFHEAESRYPTDSSLVNRFETPVVLVDRFENESISIYSVLAIDSFLKDRLKVVIINEVPPERLETVARKLLPLFQKRGLTSVFLVPKDRILSSFTVRHTVGVVQAEVLAGEKHLDNLVEATSISSTYLKESLFIFRRVYNKLILLGPTLENLTAPLPTAVTGVVLTGGRRPAPLVVNTCEDTGVPLLISPADTFSTMDKIQRQRLYITHEDGYKLRRFLQLLGGERAMQAIREQIV